jgi:cell division inhibitor SulA/protein ImuA
MHKNTLDKLLDTTPELWRGRRANHRQRTLSTGHARLDARLPGRGWPLGAVTELIAERPGLGEFSLLRPALAELGRQGQWLVLVDPPWLPYPSSLQAHGLSLERLLLVRSRNEKESRWACEQALRSGRGGAVLAWPERITFTELRRLQLAAQENARLAFLYRPGSALGDASPAALRLHLQPGGRRGTRIDILKCRGSHPPAPAWIRFSDYANATPDTAGHEPTAAHPARALLAGRAPAAPRAGPAHPRLEDAGPGGRGERDGRAPRTDH